MATAAGVLNVTSSTPVKLNSIAETDDPTMQGTSSSALTKLSGSSLIVVTSIALYFGPSTVASNGTNGASLPAGVWTFDLKGDDDIYVISPSASTTVEVLQLSV